SFVLDVAKAGGAKAGFPSLIDDRLDQIIGLADANVRIEVTAFVDFVSNEVAQNVNLAGANLVTHNDQAVSTAPITRDQSTRSHGCTSIAKPYTIARRSRHS